jgi:hypothetical protein
MLMPKSTGRKLMFHHKRSYPFYMNQLRQGTPPCHRYDANSKLLQPKYSNAVLAMKYVFIEVVDGLLLTAVDGRKATSLHVSASVHAVRSYPTDYPRKDFMQQAVDWYRRRVMAVN